MDNVKNIIASTISGMTSFITIYPSEVIKNNYQFLKNKNQSYTHVIKNIYTQNGISGFYRGMFPPLFMYGPRITTALSLNEYLKNHVTQTNYSGYITGSLSGIISGIFVATPGENIKIYSIHNNISAIKSMKQMWLSNKYYAFTKGINAIALKETLTYSGRFGTAEYFNNTLQPTNIFQTALIGGLSSSLITFLSTPFDVLVVRLQSDYNKKYTGNFNCIKNMIEEEGIKILFRGALVRTIRTFIGMFVMFGMFDSLKKLMN